ncbi:GGDEF domain-containing protein [Thalassotalea euphylliae]|uniref:GGDEF domain-containing protein n=1 Tax=Thalassotalea euphylliae TaxID=1655234 RepID=UPI0036439115
MLTVLPRLRLATRDVSFIFMLFFLLWYVIISVDRTRMAKVGFDISKQLEQLHSVVALRFANSGNIQLEARKRDLIHDHHGENKQLENFVEIRFFSSCNIYQIEDSLNGNITKLNKSVFRALPLKSRIQLAEYCDSIFELQDYASQTALRVNAPKVMAHIDTPSFLFEQENAQYSKPWLISEKSRIQGRFDNNPDSRWFVKKLDEDTIATPILVSSRPSYSLINNILGIPYGIFYRFDLIQRFEDESGLIHALRNISELVKVNSRCIVRYSPLVLLLSALLYLLCKRAIICGIRFYKFNVVFKLNSYALVKLYTHDGSVKVIGSNLRQRAKLLKSAEALTMLNEKLEPTKSFTQAKYINVEHYNEQMQFSIVSSNFNNDNQESGLMLLVNNPEIQATIAEYQSIYRIDTLTQLPNRSVLKDVTASQRTSPGYLMAIMDLDHFKNINDTYGHLFGDLVLKQFADYLRQTFGLEQHDVILRLGGEEFMLLIEVDEEVYKTSADGFANRILAFNQAAFSVSGGITHWQKGEENFDVAYKRADNLLYKAKHGGRRQVHYDRLEDIGFIDHVVGCSLTSVTTIEKSTVTNSINMQRA